MIKKFNIFFFTLFLYFFFINLSNANFQEELLNKYKTVNTLYFDFTQTIGDKIEFGNCYIKYPTLMNCLYPKKKKSIITDGKKFAIVKKRYKKIYYYPLKKTPLFYLLKKENIINLVRNYEPKEMESNVLKYELVDDNLNILRVFFDKNSLELLGWKTTDAYSNEVSFFLKNTETNILIENEIFKIPREEDL